MNWVALTFAPEGFDNIVQNGELWQLCECASNVYHAAVVFKIADRSVSGDDAFLLNVGVMIRLSNIIGVMARL